MGGDGPRYGIAAWLFARALGGIYLVHRALSPLRSFNGYRLFAVMTTERPEIVIEASDDGRTWLPYEFEHKPGDPARRPRFTTPHMPRLDWQMWFAALGRHPDHPWFSRLLAQLMRGSEAVISLARDESVSRPAAEVYSRRGLRPPVLDARGAPCGAGVVGARAAAPVPPGPGPAAKLRAERGAGAGAMRRWGPP